MPTSHEGRHDASGKRIAVVAGRYNDFVTKPLVSAAIDCIGRHGGDPDAVGVYWVPGAFEVPQMARRIAEEGRVDGIVCIGAIIRGETNHFDILCASVISSIAEIPSRCSVPVAYGVVTADTVEAAMDRAGGKIGNKGWESALALIEMMTLWER